MTRKLAALLAALMLSMLAVAPAVGGVAPAGGSLAAAALSAPASPVDESKVPHYFGPYPNWANSPQTLPDATVAIGAANPAPIIVGNPLVARTYASDDTFGSTGSGVPGQGVVLVVLPTAVPAAGILTNFQTYVQNLPALGSPDNTFNAYLLRPTGTPNEYTIVFDSGPLTVPVEPDGVHTWPVPGSGTGSTDALAGDLIAFYGQGIPLDITAGSDVVAYPAPAAPVSPFTVGGVDFPILAGPRTYSFSATITPPGTGAGSGATATATVGANGAVTGITITDPGSGYTAPPVVTITGAGAGATADAVVTSSGVVSGISVDVPGVGYKTPVVTITGGGATTDATAAAYGGVDAVVLSNPGTGYTMPTLEFDLPDDPSGLQATGHVVCVELNCNGNGGPVTITDVVVDTPGSGYASAPAIAILDGTRFDPIAGGSGATATATISVDAISVTAFGAGYTSAPAVAITDSTGTGTGATATAVTDVGAVTAINVTAPGSGYVTPGGIQKFTDPLPGLCAPPACPATGKYIPLGVPDTTTFADADTYEIGLVQYRTSFSSSLPATLVRGYVQLETAANAGASQHFPLSNELMDGTFAPTGYFGVTPPQWLGPTIVATKDKPVRIVFRNLLPTGTGGDLFLPTDSSMMGSGMLPVPMAAPVDEGTVMDDVRNPMCTDYPKSDMCFKDNRATLHLHGGTTPWISDGTAHQWITPAGETTTYPQGVGVENVPDMAASACDAATDGCMTFYYTNQQSARLLFYHDHAWGITRLNVYAGEAAGYLITDPTEQKLIGPGGALETVGLGTPLVIQDRTFVPSPEQLAQQDPTWNTAQWGGMGSFWYHHVYMPAQNPGDPSGMSSYGRWMYGPWFWPPATPPHGPIANPYYNMDPNAVPPFSAPLATPCNLDVPSTWQYQVAPFCEPALIPGTPNISVGMEQFNDTPIVNGTAYPTVTVDPQSYRYRILNAANDRFWNLQWYVADPTTGTDSEVALDPADVAAAQTDPVVFPRALKSMVVNGATVDLSGPDWIQIGSEGGFLPAPTVVDGQQVTTWITDPTRFDVGNVDLHSLLLAPAERADVIVDFSKFAGKTLILYNDAPAAFPARVPSYDYYTGGPDGLTLPGYGPNTRTIMQVKVAATAPAAPFNLTALQNAFKHHADGSGVFESGQHPVIVGQAAYNSAYGTSFAASGDCTSPTSTTKCDGMARINQQGGDPFTFDTLRGIVTPANPKLSIPLQPKALHDEMNSAAFDEFGRMTANLGLEAVPATPAAQTIILYPFVNPGTEFIDGTNLQSAGIHSTPISSASDGTQIWKFTHNGVDTHPIHFHLYDVQVLNRVTWDNIIIPTEPSELGWKDTVRISPLEDTIVALRPVIPAVPFEVPNSIRSLNPMMPVGDTSMFNPVDIHGDPTADIVNQLVNFGWEYVYHCHILSHEEMDMMRPVSLALPPLKADGLARSITGAGNNQRNVIAWNDNSITETSFVLQRTVNGLTWTDVGTLASPLDQANTHGPRSLRDATSSVTASYLYRVVAKNTVGLGGAFPSITVQSISDPISVNSPVAAPLAPTLLTATVQAGPQVRLQWRDNATNEGGFVIERAVTGGQFAQIAVAPLRNGTGNVTFTDTTVATGTTYSYRVAAVNLFGGAPTLSAYSNEASTVAAPPVPAAPSNLTATIGANQGTKRSVVLTWTDSSANETSFTVQRATNAAFTTGLATTTVAANAITNTQTGLNRATTYYFRIRANNAVGSSAWVNATPFPIVSNP